MLTLEQVISSTAAAMTEPQARALYGLIYGQDSAAKAETLELLKVHRCDRFEAHRILAYVLSHTMSDETNKAYVIEQLGLGDNT